MAKEKKKDIQINRLKDKQINNSIQTQHSKPKTAQHEPH